MLSSTCKKKKFLGYELGLNQEKSSRSLYGDFTEGKGFFLCDTLIERPWKHLQREFSEENV